MRFASCKGCCFPRAQWLLGVFLSSRFLLCSPYSGTQCPVTVTSSRSFPGYGKGLGPVGTEWVMNPVTGLSVCAVCTHIPGNRNDGSGFLVVCVGVQRARSFIFAWGESKYWQASEAAQEADVTSEGLCHCQGVCVLREGIKKPQRGIVGNC